MYQPAPFHRRDSITRHPPYGLYLDPHRGQHNWTAASTRLVLAVAVIVASIVLMSVLGFH